jgi:hypothetical protein
MRSGGCERFDFRSLHGDHRRRCLLQQGQLRLQLEDLLLKGSDVHQSRMSDHIDSEMFQIFAKKFAKSSMRIISVIQPDGYQISA